MASYKLHEKKNVHENLTFVPGTFRHSSQINDRVAGSAGSPAKIYFFPVHYLTPVIQIMVLQNDKPDCGTYFIQISRWAPYAP